MAYHVTGMIAAAAFLLTLLGEIFQLRKVRDRRREQAAGRLAGEEATAVLSLNQVASLFLACFAFFLYAISLHPVNHYLAWPRIGAALLAIALLHQLSADRRTWSTRAAFGLGVAALLGGPALLWLRPGAPAGTLTAQVLIVAATVVLAQGNLHQILLIRHSGRTGAVSLRFHQCVLLSGLTTVVFGLAMGWAQGWPLVLMASVSALLKGITLWHFRWVRLSPLALARRGSSGA